jgi:hypothetical protein
MDVIEKEINKWAECNDSIFWIDDLPWQVRNKMLLPLSMPHTIQIVDQKKIKLALERTNAILAHWTDDWNRSESEWWWTCCDDKDYDLENIKNTDGRKNIRKGLRECSIERIDIEDFSNKAYQVHCEAISSYGVVKSSIPTIDQFRDVFRRMSKYSGFEIWGAYVKNRLVAFATCLVVDNAVTLTNTRSDPEYHKHRPNNALIYEITRHYLKNRNVSYVSNGPRNLLHQTSINSFLIKMGYRKIYGRLNLVLSKKANFLILTGIGVWGKYLTFLKRYLPNQLSSLNGFLKIIEISRSF